MPPTQPGQPVRTGKSILIMFGLWTFLLVPLGLWLYISYISPWLENRQKQGLVDDTSSDSQYKHIVRVAADPFSGYAILRSPDLRDRNRQSGIKLKITDDKGDYRARIRALKDRSVDIAVFTIDSQVATGAELGEHPATTVMVIDESHGADAIVSYSAVRTLADLNTPDATFVLTPDSPWEFLVRIASDHFSLSIPPERWVRAESSTDVLNRFLTADKSAKRAYVLGEPDLSRALATEGSHELLGSDKLRGFIIDILVVERQFLAEHPDVVRTIVENYFRSLYVYQQQPNGLKDLVMDDAKRSGAAITVEQAERTVVGISWKNVLENYAHFGLLNAQDASGLETLEDIIAKVTNVQVQTGKIQRDPTDGKPNLLFYDKIIRGLKEGNFHPGRKTSVLAVENGAAPIDVVRGVEELAALTETQWGSLVTVGEMRVDPIQFGRGSFSLTDPARRNIDKLAKNLQSWPEYYLTIVGHTSAKGDREANRQLAEKRAKAVTRYLISGGVSENRIRAIAEEPKGTGADAQVVRFVLGQLAY